MNSGQRMKNRPPKGRVPSLLSETLPCPASGATTLVSPTSSSSTSALLVAAKVGLSIEMLPDAACLRDLWRRHRRHSATAIAKSSTAPPMPARNTTPDAPPSLSLPSDRSTGGCASVGASVGASVVRASMGASVGDADDVGDAVGVSSTGQRSVRLYDAVLAVAGTKNGRVLPGLGQRRGGDVCGQEGVGSGCTRTSVGVRGE